jgi:plastocyanin domain-containing protein
MKQRITTLQKITFLGTLVGFGFLLGAISGVLAAEMNTGQPATQFQPIEQPLQNKIVVTLGGLGLIGAELWWFLLSKPKSHNKSHKAIDP